MCIGELRVSSATNDASIPCNWRKVLSPKSPLRRGLLRTRLTDAGPRSTCRLRQQASGRRAKALGQSDFTPKCPASPQNASWPLSAICSTFRRTGHGSTAPRWGRNCEPRRQRGLPPARSAACVYTCSPDADFVIGPLDGMERITVVSACSGHGFKHSAAVGEHAVRLITEGPAAAIPAFDPRRLNRMPQP